MALRHSGLMDRVSEAMDYLKEIFAKVRVLLARKLNRLVLGPIVGKLTCRSVRSLEEIYYREQVREHIVDIVRTGDPVIVKYNFPPGYPPHFCKERAFEKRDVFILKDVCVAPRSGLVWFPEGYVLEESVGSFKRIMYGWDGVLHQPMLGVDPLVSERPIVSCAPTGYFHWLLERMPVLLQALAVAPHAQILVPRNGPPYLWNALELLLGADALKTRVVAANRPVAVSRFVMPRSEINSGFVHPEDIQLLRGAFKKSAAGHSRAGNGFLYVSRRKAISRKLANEEILEAELSALGFDVVYAEDLTFAEQIALFSKARFIVAPHGAGLSNIVWADPPCRVLEIFPSDMSNDCYARLAVSLGFGYEYLVCEADGATSGRIRIPDVLASVMKNVAGRDSTLQNGGLRRIVG